MNLEQLQELATLLQRATGLLMEAGQEGTDRFTQLLEMMDEVETEITIAGSQE
ncbi:MAG: hypothetical protein KA314_04855 [Chloroflexi bacterium]|nr:hypothetical protein [Chloroflexota bacterium]